MNFNRRKTLAILAGAAAVPALAGVLPAGQQRGFDADVLTTEEARAIGKEVFLWGMHPVAIYHLRYIHAQNEASRRYVGVNRLLIERKPITAMPRFATMPNATTLYGVAMLDLVKEPVVVTVPAISDRYWSLQLADNYARWWHMIGSQFTGKGPVQRLLVGPGWRGRLPEGFVGEQIIQSPSDFSVAALRMALTDDSPEELNAINACLDRVTLMPLSQWLAAGKREVRAEDVPVQKASYPVFAGMEAVREPGRLRGMDLLRWVSLVLEDPTFTKQADGFKEIQALARFERLGLKVGHRFDPDRLPEPIRTAVQAGIEDGVNEVRANMAKGSGIPMNGWSLSTDLGYHDTDWLRRARAGLIAVLGPVPVRSHTAAIGNKDAQGQPLTGAHRYTITFDLDDLPPVTEFWEIPLYDSEGYFVDNPINRYSLNSFMLAHGKLHTQGRTVTIYVQHEEPQNPAHKQNWLPAPKEGFQFTARFYGPHAPLIDGSYHMPSIVRVA